MTAHSEALRQIERLGITEKQIAEQLGVSLSWIQHDRCGARILPFYRIGGHIRYSPQRVREALARVEEGGQPRRMRAAA